jgi:predicted amidohydrolase YtcJ
MKILGALAVLLFCSSLFAADLVIKNGTIITMDSVLPHATAMAMTGDRIVWVGETKDSTRYIGPKTQVLDLSGKFVFPGFIDSHAHIRSLGQSHMQIDLVDTRNKAAVINMVKEGVAKAKKGEWVLGRGWDQNDWPEKNFPNAADLDSISPDNPVVLERVDGHAYWVNSKTLSIAEITESTKDPDGGKILRDSRGKPTGVLVDNATDLVDAKMKSLTIPEIIQRTNLALQDAVRKGITMIDDAGSPDSDLQAWKELAAKNELPVRIYSMVWMPSEFGENYLKTGPQHYGPYLEVRSLKLVLDGALGSRGAALLEPYSDDPGNSGLLRWKEEEMLRVLQAAKAKGIQVGIHAIGDRANRMVLDAYQKVGVKGLRWRIEHAQILTLNDISRLSEMGIIASMQPTHATSDMPWATDRVSPERIKGAYAWRSLLDRKTIIAGGSDAPVEDINPLWGIYSAITRQDHEGKPEGGWHPEQLVTRQEALKMFTVSGAYTAFRENELGMLKPHFLADLVVLPENLLTCEPKDMINMKVSYTIVGGKIRYSGE